MIVYNYHPETGEHTGSTAARIDPIDRVPMLPANATFLAPPAAGEDGYIAVFCHGIWSLKPDNRDVDYWVEGVKHTITEIGIEVPEGASLTEPNYIPTNADIDRERDRRMSLGAVVPVTGRDPIHVTGNPSDQIIFGSLMDTARYLADLGVTDPVITLRDANNVNHMLNPAQIMELVMGGRAAGAAIYEASWVLKDNPPIPDDYADDAHWPALIPDGEPE